MSHFAASAQTREQRLPTAGVPVPRGRTGNWQRPLDREVGVVKRHSQIFGRVMRPVDAVADVGLGGERLEPVQVTGRNVEVVKIDVVEFERLRAPESRGLAADVDEHVENCAVCASHQLGLALPGAPVHPAHHSERRARLRVLDEVAGVARTIEEVVEDQRVKSPGEEPAAITMRFGDEKQNVREIRGFDAHEAMIP